MHFYFFEKLGASVICTAWLVYGSILAGDYLVSPNQAPDSLRAAGPEKVAAKKTAAQPAEQDLSTLLAAADAEKGIKVFKKCKACHTTKNGGANKVGPNLWDVVGKDIATASGFAYSKAMAGFGGNWGYDELNAYLTKPKAYVPGTKMSFAGLKKATDRANVIGYLRTLSDSPKPLP